MEAHGGYLCRLEDFGTVNLVGLARESLLEEGLDPSDAGLLVTPLRDQVVRLAYDTPRLYGRPGSHWYGKHHGLARRLSSMFAAAVHAYVFDPIEHERFVTLLHGHTSITEGLRYDDVEALDEVSEVAYLKLQEGWPLGRLARSFGVTRQELLRLPREASTLLELGGDALPVRPPLLWPGWAKPLRRLA